MGRRPSSRNFYPTILTSRRTWTRSSWATSRSAGYSCRSSRRRSNAGRTAERSKCRAPGGDEARFVEQFDLVEKPAPPSRAHPYFGPGFGVALQARRTTLLLDVMKTIRGGRPRRALERESSALSPATWSAPRRRRSRSAAVLGCFFADGAKREDGEDHGLAARVLQEARRLCA